MRCRSPAPPNAFTGSAVVAPLWLIGRRCSREPERARRTCEMVMQGAYLQCEAVANRPYGVWPYTERHMFTRLALAAALLMTQPGPTIRVLFIGNSLTYANDLPAMVCALARVGGTAGRSCETVAKPDYGLEEHWNEREARQAIARGWDVVVLQQGPSALPESRRLLIDYTRRFDAEIKKAGARTALYMVWPSRARRGDFPGVSQSYAAAAKDVNGPASASRRRVARGMGHRFADYRCMDRMVSIRRPMGTYLAALVIYEQIFASRRRRQGPCRRRRSPSRSCCGALRTKPSCRGRRAYRGGLSRRYRRDRVGERAVQLVVDAMQEPVDQLHLERAIHGRLVAGDRHHQILDLRHDLGARRVGIEAASLRVGAALHQLLEHRHRRLEQLLVAQRLAVAGDDDRGIERVDVLERLDPAGGVRAQARTRPD